MADQWYYASQGQQLGPVSPEQLRQAAVGGALLPSDLVWKPGMGDWVPARNLNGLFPKGPPPLPSPTMRAAPGPFASPASQFDNLYMSPIEQNRRGARPEIVGTAIMLLYISLGVGVLRGMIDAARTLQSVPPEAAGVFVLTIAAVLGVCWLFFYLIGKGHNWARVTFLVLFIIGAPLSVAPLLKDLADNPPSGLLGIGQTILQIVALVYLFQGPSSEWFGAKKGD